jgi:hypothetical protein
MWKIRFSQEFGEWYQALEKEIQIELIAKLDVLKNFGPGLGRPLVDTIKGSKISNLKELRLNFKRRPIRIFFLFDPARRIFIMVGGFKDGSREKKFYSTMISQCEVIYARYQKERQENEDF